MDIVVNVCRQRRHKAQLNSIQPWTQRRSGQLQGEGDEDLCSNPSGLAPSEMTKRLVLNDKLERNSYSQSLVFHILIILTYWEIL